MAVFGTILMVLAYGLSLMASIGVAFMAGRDSKLMGFAVFFIWPVWLWYVVTNFDETKGFIGMSVAGFVLALGAGMAQAVGTDANHTRGAAFGSGHDWYQCEEEAAKRLQGCGESTECGRNASSFLDGCLGSAHRTEGYCADVPAGSQDRVELWVEQTCPRLGLGYSDGCRELLWHVSELCAG